MGYNLSRHSVIRNKPQLDQLRGASGDVRFPTTNPLRLASKLREAIKAAGEFPDLKHYHEELTSKFKFKVERDGVLAEYIDFPLGVPVRENNNEVVNSNTPPQKGIIESCTSLIDVLSGVMEGEKKGYIELYFPNAILNYDDKVRLYEASKSGEWGYIDHGDRGLTMTKAFDMEELYWEPDDG